MSRPAAAYYRDAEQRTFLIMRVCSYLHRGEPCNGCPEWEESRVTGVGDLGKIKRVCRAMSEELIAVVHESLAKGPEEVVQDNEPWPPARTEEEVVE